MRPLKKREDLWKKSQLIDLVLSKRSRRRKRKGEFWTRGKGLNPKRSQEGVQMNPGRNSTSPISEALAQVAALRSGAQPWLVTTAHERPPLPTSDLIGHQGPRNWGHKEEHLKLPHPSLPFSHLPSFQRKQLLVACPLPPSTDYKPRFSRQS